MNAATPLYYEMAVESAYPIAEGTVTAVLTSVQNAFVFVFLLALQLAPSLSTAWLNWAVVGACAAAFAMVVPLAEQQRRLAVDAGAAIVGADARERV